jgi:ABC-2 type transport system permease protein
VNYLGRPDNTAIFLTYMMSFLMAGAYVSIGAAISALTGSQVTAFVLSVVTAFVFTAAGWPVVLSGVQAIFGVGAADMAAQFSFLTHFEGAQRGVLDLRAVVFFVGFTGFWAVLNGFWAARQRLG